MKLFKKVILFFVLFSSLALLSCEAEEEGCELETVCFGEGNCIERPIPGTCF